MEIENEIKAKARFLYTCKYNGKETMRNCLTESIFDLTHLNEAQICSVFGYLQKDLGFDAWVDKMLGEM